MGTRNQQQGILETIERGLSIKFGAKGLELMPKISKIIDIAKLREIKETIKMAKDLKEIEAFIPEKKRKITC